MSKFCVDFEFAGHVEVEAKTEDEAVALVEDMGLSRLEGHIQNFNVGKYYKQR